MEDIVTRLWYLYKDMSDPHDILSHVIVLYPDILHYRNPEHHGATLLHLFVKRDDHDMCRFCLENGADVDSRDDTGRTPLSYVSFPSHDIAIEIIDLLLIYRANINSLDDNGLSIINHCCYRGRLDQVMHLLKQGADINTEKNGRRTCLYRAIYHESPELFWAVLKGGAYIENDTDTVTYFKRHSFFYYSYYNKKLDLLRNMIAFCSVKLVNRMGVKSKLRHLSMDIIRKLFSEFI